SLPTGLRRLSAHFLRLHADPPRPPVATIRRPTLSYRLPDARQAPRAHTWRLPPGTGCLPPAHSGSRPKPAKLPLSKFLHCCHEAGLPRRSARRRDCWLGGPAFPRVPGTVGLPAPESAPQAVVAAVRRHLAAYGANLCARLGQVPPRNRPRSCSAARTPNLPSATSALAPHAPARLPAAYVVHSPACVPVWRGGRKRSEVHEAAWCPVPVALQVPHIPAQLQTGVLIPGPGMLGHRPQAAWHRAAMSPGSAESVVSVVARVADPPPARAARIL